jgi:hypothetical protein
MEALSPIEAIGANGGPVIYPEDDENYPVPRVTAPRVLLRRTNFRDAREKPQMKASRKSGPEKDDVLPRVASTSTVLAPIGAKTNYVGPALLRSRQAGLKRSSSGGSKDDRGENPKKPRSELVALSGYGLYF